MNQLGFKFDNFQGSNKKLQRVGLGQEWPSSYYEGSEDGYLQDGKQSSDHGLQKLQSSSAGRMLCHRMERVGNVLQ